MSNWRVIITDSESETGVAPVCPQPDVHAMQFSGSRDDPHVFDECCVGPHLECGTPSAAIIVAAVLNAAAVRDPVTTPPIPPAAMIEAVKAEFLAVTGMPSVEPADTEYAKRLTAAALGVCEVREGYAADTGDYVTTTPLDRAAAQREVDAANDHSRGRGNAPHTRLVRRLWITSPAEQVDP